MVAQNPVALAANTLRQIGESGNQAVMGLGNTLSQTASQLLRGLGGGGALPFGLPNLPGLPGLGNAGGSSHNNGNPNGNGAGPLGLPAIGALIPAQAVQAVTQLEAAVLPPGLPRPAAILMQALGVGQAPTPEPTPVETGIRPTERPGRGAGLDGLNGIRQPGQDMGIQLV